jgi:DNA-binding LytR/AlgR family response regulator
MQPRAIVAEDEPSLAEELCERLRRVWPELTICAVARDGIEALQQVETHDAQILFLDIQMPGVNGLDVARINAGRCHVVFVTAFDQYAIDAFEQGAVDYVMKPINEARLFTTVQRLRQRLRDGPADTAPALQQLAAREQSQYLRWINASHGAEIRVVTTDEVCYFRAEDKYTIVVTESDEALVRKPLKDLVTRLDPAVFWQIHRSTVVNANAIAGVTRDFRGHLKVRLKRRPELLAVAESCNHLFRQM